jgi:hypothetical protein
MSQKIDIQEAPKEVQKPIGELCRAPRQALLGSLVTLRPSRAKIPHGIGL